MPDTKCPPDNRVDVRIHDSITKDVEAAKQDAYFPQKVMHFPNARKAIAAEVELGISACHVTEHTTSLPPISKDLLVSDLSRELVSLLEKNNITLAERYLQSLWNVSATSDSAAFEKNYAQYVYYGSQDNKTKAGEKLRYASEYARKLQYKNRAPEVAAESLFTRSRMIELLDLERRINALSLEERTTRHLAIASRAEVPRHEDLLVSRKRTTNDLILIRDARKPSDQTPPDAYGAHQLFIATLLSELQAKHVVVPELIGTRRYHATSTDELVLQLREAFRQGISKPLNRLSPGELDAFALFGGPTVFAAHRSDCTLHPAISPFERDRIGNVAPDNSGEPDRFKEKVRSIRSQRYLELRTIAEALYLRERHPGETVVAIVDAGHDGFDEAVIQQLQPNPMQTLPAIVEYSWQRRSNKE